MSTDDAKEFTVEATQLVTSMKGTKISNVGDLVAVVYPLMQLASKFSHLTGDQKKATVMSSLGLLISNSDMNATAKEMLTTAVNTVVPAVIDEFYTMNVAELKGLFSCCC